MNHSNDDEALPQSEAVLRELLSKGPKHSRDLMAEMLARQFTPKQVRRARERQGVVALRAGSGKTMHTTWALPGLRDGAHPNSSEMLGARIAEEKLPTVDAIAAVEPAITEGEQRRLNRRIDYFKTKGMNEVHAARLAVRLAIERDRTGLLTTSCAECQNLNNRGECRAAMDGFGAGPRQAFEFWHCYLARQVIP